MKIRPQILKKISKLREYFLNIPPLDDKRVILYILFLGIINGLIFVFLVPPWQHYDEPGHFEYAWLIANHNKLPEAGDYDQEMRIEVAASMIEHGFFDKLKFRPNLLSQSEPIWIGKIGRASCRERV